MTDAHESQKVLDLIERIRTRDVTIEVLAQIIAGRNWEIRSARAELLEVKQTNKIIREQIVKLHLELSLYLSKRVLHD